MKSKRFWIRHKIKQLVDNGMDLPRAQLEAQQIARRMGARERLKQTKLDKMERTGHDNQDNSESEKGADAPARVDAGLRHESGGKKGGTNNKPSDDTKERPKVFGKGGRDNRGRDVSPKRDQPSSVKVRANAGTSKRDATSGGNGSGKRPSKDA